jgi:hypothetical protein
VSDETAALVRALRLTGAAVFVLAVLTLTLPAEPARSVALAMAGLLVGTPLARVGALGLVWLRRGDRPFGLAALALLGIVLAGAVAAAVTGLTA